MEAALPSDAFALWKTSAILVALAIFAMAAQRASGAICGTIRVMRAARRMRRRRAEHAARRLVETRDEETCDSEPEESLPCLAAARGALAEAGVKED